MQTSMETSGGLLSSPRPRSVIAENAALMGQLNDAAEILAAQGDLAERVAACRRTSEALRGLREPVRKLLRSAGPAGLQDLAGGEGWLARGIAEYVSIGCWQTLERLRGWADPEAVLCTLPGVDALAAARLHDLSEADTIDALDAVLRDRQRAAFSVADCGWSESMVASVSSLATRLRGLRQAFGEPAVPAAPPVDLLLEVDRRYRLLAASGRLSSIRPRRTPPGSLTTLPVMHCSQLGWHFTSLFANTARARRFGALRDWVVIHVEHHQQAERASMVVTSGSGALRGCRVVRGREPECRQSYAAPVPGAAGCRNGSGRLSHV